MLWWTLNFQLLPSVLGLIETALQLSETHHRDGSCKTTELPGISTSSKLLLVIKTGKDCSLCHQSTPFLQFLWIQQIAGEWNLLCASKYLQQHCILQENVRQTDRQFAWQVSSDSRNPIQPTRGVVNTIRSNYETSDKIYTHTPIWHRSRQRDALGKMRIRALHFGFLVSSTVQN